MNDKWLTWKPDDVRVEARQGEEEGRDLAAVRDELDALAADGADAAEDYQQRVNALLDRVQTLPLRPDYAYVEPSDLAGIRDQRPDGPRRLTLRTDEAALADKVHGAWLGRCVGCLLGKPVENAKSHDIQGLVRSTGAEFISDYLWRMSPTQDACEQAGRAKLLEFGRGIAHMPVDDDTNYTLIGLAAVKDHGIDFTPDDMAHVWMGKLPVLATCTAERVAYRNFVNQVAPPASATRRNPYREWIGAQIRADAFGYVALGRPELAAELAWRDASISHVRNGIYGEMWVAAMLAAAAVEGDARRVIEIGLSEVPAKSRLAEAIREVLAWRDEGIDYTEACERLADRWDEYNRHHWCHTISNAVIVAISLLWSEGDFEKAVTRAVWPGFDTDCNGATVGSVMGMILGADALPEKWTAILNDTVHTSVDGYTVASISETAREMYELSRQTREM